MCYHVILIHFGIRWFTGDSIMCYDHIAGVKIDYVLPTKEAIVKQYNRETYLIIRNNNRDKNLLKNLCFVQNVCQILLDHGLYQHEKEVDDE